MNQKVKTLSSRQLNVTNSCQTEAKRVLCVCTAGILRSPTAANVLNQEFGYNTRSCGVDERFALIPLDEVLLEWADEIVVIDSFSTDKTVEIATKMKAKVLQRKFDNFSSQKNYAIDQAKYDWIFVLDADERLTEDLKLEILDKLYSPGNDKSFWIPRNNYFQNKKVRFSGWQNDKVMRLFNRKYAKYNGKLVHEEVVCKAETGSLKSYIEHYTYESYSDYLQKIKSYSRLKAMELYKKNIRPNFFYRYIKPAYRFAYHYLITFGFLDGKTGFTIAKINAIGMRERYRKLKELYKQNKNKS